MQITGQFVCCNLIYEYRPSFSSILYQLFKIDIKFFIFTLANSAHLAVYNKRPNFYDACI